jgi:hypothetical protein
MTSLLLFVLAVIGMTNILVDSRLFEPVRCWLQKVLPTKVYEVLECHQCTGFWTGMICGLILLSFNPFIVFACGCAGSFVSAFAYILMEFILSKTEFSLEVPAEEPKEENVDKEVRNSL